MKVFVSLFLVIVSNNIFAGEPNYEGMIRFDEQCSGSLVKFANQPSDQNAYILTNAHCLNRDPLLHGEALIDVEYQVRDKVFIVDSNKVQYPVEIKRLVYATMTNTDIALFSLTKTYQEIEQSLGIKPLIISPNISGEGVRFGVISGYWLETYNCSIDKFVHKYVVGHSYTEDTEYRTTTNNIKYSKGGTCDETPGGSSGSPIVQEGTRTIIGIHGTANIFNDIRACEFFSDCEVVDGEIILRRPACSEHNGCEIDEKGHIKVDLGARYGFQVFDLYGCLTNSFTWDFNLETCKLAK